MVRPELTQPHPEVYRLTEGDIADSLSLTERLVASHVFRTEHELRDLRNDPSDTAVEIISDAAHYANLDISYIWAFTLWRLQAVFEGIVAQSFLPPTARRESGFAAKLRAVRDAGFRLSADDEAELLAWARVRNRLSHRPEWFFHLTEVTQQDVEEYAGLICRILNDWKGGGEFLPYAPDMAEAYER